MAAAPKSGSLIFRGAETGRSYSVSVYISDVSGAYVRFNQDGAAGTASPDFYVPPENVVLQDFSVATGLTDTTVLKILVGGVSIGQVLQDANHVNSLPFRPPINVPIGRGREVRIVQA